MTWERIGFLSNGGPGAPVVGIGRPSAGSRQEEATLSIAAGGNRVAVQRAAEIRLLAADDPGSVEREIGRFEVSGPVSGVALLDEEVWIARPRGVERLDAGGTAWSDPVRLGWVTAVAVTEEDVFLADAASRRIQRYDRDGVFRNEIGDRHRKGGFHIPNGTLDVAIDPQGRVVVANPGMHRVELYRPDGEMVGRFGRFDGVDPSGFPGCCNPTNLAVAPDGRVVVSEKAQPRVKVYGADGTFLGVVAQGGAFEPTAKNMDVAIDALGRIWVVDPVASAVSVFAPRTVAAEVAS